MKIPLLMTFIVFAGGAPMSNAAEYYRSKWFDYPDPTTMPKTTVSCAQEGSIDVPCPTWSEPLRMCRKSACTGHTYKTEMLRVAPTFVVNGPDTSDQAVKNAITGVAATCAATAISAAQGAAAATPSPEPAARISAGLAMGIAYFQSCISTVSGAAVAGGLINQLSFTIETPTHWAPL